MRICLFFSVGNKSNECTFTYIWRLPSRANPPKLDVRYLTLDAFTILVRSDSNFSFENFPKVAGTFKSTISCNIKNLFIRVLNEELSGVADADIREAMYNGLSGSRFKKCTHVIF